MDNLLVLAVLFILFVLPFLVKAAIVFIVCAAMGQAVDAMENSGPSSGRQAAITTTEESQPWPATSYTVRKMK